MLKVLIPALCLAFASLTASADSSLVQSDFDIAGVTLGMQPDAVTAALEERGYALGEAGTAGTRRGPSFEQIVAIEAGTLTKRAATDSWKEMTFRKGNDQGVYVRFKPLAVGTSASIIIYVNTAMAPETFFTAAEGKYGPPHYENRKLRRWSDKPLPNGTQVKDGSGAISLDARAGTSRPGVQGFRGVKVSLTLRGGKVSLADVKADVAAAGPKEATF